jgi:DNA polymerase III epsilon subunit-like protein
MRWRDCSIIAFDTETTGLYPEEGHRIIEFAGIEFKLGVDGSIKQLIPHHYLFNPEMPIPKEATEVSGIRDEDVASASVFGQHAEAIQKLLSKAVTVAHNYPFDQRFLSYELMRVGLKWPYPPAELDTVDISRQFFPEARSHRLGELSARLEVSLIGAHRATNDAEACGRCFLAMAGRFGAPDDLDGLLDWAGAVGLPPETGHIGKNKEGEIVFLEGEAQGEPIERHPDTLMWMPLARVRENGSWQRKYPEALSGWIERWLKSRASGRALGGGGGGKGFGPLEWGIDPPLSAR